MQSTTSCRQRKENCKGGEQEGGEEEEGGQETSER